MTQNQLNRYLKKYYIYYSKHHSIHDPTRYPCIAFSKGAWPNPMFTSRIWRCQGWASTCLDKTAWLIGFLLETFKMLIQPPHMKKGCSPQIKLNMIFVSRSRSQQASSLLWRKDVVSCGYYMLLGRFGTNSILLRNID